MVPRGARNELAIQLTSALETRECPAAGRSQLCVWEGPDNNTMCMCSLPSWNQQSTMPALMAKQGQGERVMVRTLEGRGRVATQTTKE